MAESATARAAVSERRKSQRNSVFDHVLIPVEMEPAGFGLMMDVSESGLGVQVLNSVEVGTDVEFSFTLPDSSIKIEGTGQVTRYDHEGRAGIKVHQLKGGSAGELKRWLKSLPASTIQKGSMESGSEAATLDRVREVKAQIAAHRLDLERSLQLIVEKVIEFTGSHGAAIALGTSDDMVCCASVGLAPEPGVKIDASSALTGECIRTAKTVRCDDTELDRRVDRDVCRDLNLRSSLIIPVMKGGDVRGVLEAFSPNPRAYGEQHTSLLERLAEMTSELAFTNADKVAKPTIVPQVVKERKPSLLNAEVATAVKTAQEASKPESDGTSALESIEIGDLFKQAVSGPEPVAMASLPAEAPVEEAVETTPVTSMFGAIPFADEAFHKATRETTRSRMMVIIPAAVFVLLLVFGIIAWRSKKASTDAPKVIPPSEAASQPVAAAPVQPAATQPAENHAANQATGDSAKSPEAKTRQPEHVAEDSVRRPAEDNRLILTPGRQSFQSDDGPISAPSITGISMSPNMGSVKLPASANTPVLSVSSSSLTGGRLIQKVNPVYPVFAKQQRYEGEVVLAIRITKLGTVENIRRVKGNAVLAGAAIRAVSEWRYEPYRLNGQPQDVDTNVSVTFKLPK
ncbi:MAG TPA: TonB family protein [Terriglobales bacterium]|nr:TonB family protein [Terriglobales bacterium]